MHRSADDREPWHEEQALTPREALAASVDGQPMVRVGSRGDLVLLERDLADGADGADTAATGKRCARAVAATLVAQSPRALDAGSAAGTDGSARLGQQQ